MLLYILLFFLLASLFLFVLIAIMLIKFLGLVPMVKKIITKLFSHKYDKKFFQNGRQPINTDCYICLQKSKCEVVATCNHSFCSHCILDYIQSRRGQKINCPACRKQVCVLLRRFQPDSSSEKLLKERIAEFNCSNSKQIGFFRAISEFSNIIKHVDILFSVEGIKHILQSPRIKNILMLLIYTLSPVDLMPEMFLGPLGLADDTFASLQMLRQFSNLWLEFVRDESRRQGVAAN